MKARFTTYNSALTFEIEGDGPKAIVKELAAIQEVFDSERECGVCHGNEIRFQFRQVDDYDFYELVCLVPSCRARFAFGQAKKGGALFPKRKDEDGKWMDNGGWSKYVKSGDAPTPADQPAGRSAAEVAMQPIYVRLAAKFNVHPPVSFQAAIALMYDQLRKVEAVDKYQSIMNAFAGSPKGREDPSIMKKVLADLFTAFQDASDNMRAQDIATDDAPF